jgi:hypothetical protein
MSWGQRSLGGLITGAPKVAEAGPWPVESNSLWRHFERLIFEPSAADGVPPYSRLGDWETHRRETDNPSLRLGTTTRRLISPFFFKGAQKLFIVLYRHAAVRIAIRTKHIAVRK